MNRLRDASVHCFRIIFRASGTAELQQPAGGVPRYHSATPCHSFTLQLAVFLATAHSPSQYRCSAPAQQQQEAAAMQLLPAVQQPHAAAPPPLRNRCRTPPCRRATATARYSNASTRRRDVAKPPYAAAARVCPTRLQGRLRR